MPIGLPADIADQIDIVEPVAFCFYVDGWNGPGLYQCGYRLRRGFGWHGARGGGGRVVIHGGGGGRGHIGRGGGGRRWTGWTAAADRRALTTNIDRTQTSVLIQSEAPIRHLPDRGFFASAGAVAIEFGAFPVTVGAQWPAA